MKKYTNYELTDAMLKRLSAIVNGRRHKFGTSLQALEKRGLVESENFTRFGSPTGPWKATDTGRAALERARKEGW